MSRTISILFLAVVLAACQTPGSSKPTISSETSTSGLEYSLINMPGNSRVSIQIAWPNRWALSNDNNQATPYIGAELILAGGAVGYKAGDVVESFTDMKSEGYLGSSPDYVMGTLHYSPEHATETLKIANAHLRAPTFDERWFSRIQDQFVASAREARARSGAKGFEAARWAVLGDHPGREALDRGNAELLASVSKDEVVSWAKEIIVRNGVTIAIAGDLSAASAGKAVDVLFDNIPEGSTTGPFSVDTNYSPRRILLHTPEASTSVMSFIGPMPPAREGGEFEDFMLVDELRREQGILFEAVRTKLRATYSYGAGLDAFTREDRILVLSGEVETSKVAAAEKVVREAYATFLKEGTLDNLGERKKPYLENLNNFEKDTGGMAFSVLLATLDAEPATRVLELKSELSAVTQQSISGRLASAFPKSEELLLVVSSPDATAIEDACVITLPEQALEC